MNACADCPLRSRVELLQAQLEASEARLDELERLLVADFSPPPEWGLPRREAQIFSLLLKRDRVTKEMLATVFRDAATEDTDIAVWETHVSKMRKRLRPFGVEIECKRHLGYRLLNRERFQASFKQSQAAA